MRLWDQELLMKKANSPVKDGLMLHLDGIDNTRHGHDANATSWEDLSGNEYDFVNHGAGINNNCYSFGGSAYLSGNPIDVDNHNYTMEVVIKTPPSSSAMFVFINQGENIGFSLTGSSFISGYSRYTDQGAVYGALVLRQNKILKISEVGFHEKVLFNNSAQTKSSNDWWNYTGNEFVIGARYFNSAYTNFFSGNIYAVRMYNRKLSEKELTQNYLYDKKRFGIEVQL